MPASNQQLVVKLLTELSVDPTNELDTLMVFTASEFFREHTCFEVHEIACGLHAQKHNAYFAYCGIPPLTISDAWCPR